MKNYRLKLTTSSMLVVAVYLASFIVFTSCGGGNSGSSGNETVTSEENKVVDTKAFSNSKGIGKFSDVKLEAVDAAKADIGKTIFATKCATCHKLTDIKFVGPGLKGVTDRRTPEWILNMMTNPAEMIAKDPVAKQLFTEILSPMAFQNISEDDATNILNYLRQNDGK